MDETNATPEFLTFIVVTISFWSGYFGRVLIERLRKTP